MPPETATVTTAAAVAAPSPADDRLEAGLDALQTVRDQRPAGRSPALPVGWPPLLAVLLLLALWEGGVRLGLQPRSVVPGPGDVARALATLWHDGQAQTALATSLGRGALGFLASVAIGTPLGVLVARIGWLRVSVGPLMSGLQVLPSVAWVPAALIWFGLSDATVYFVVLMGAVPSVINGLVSGVEQVPTLFLHVGRVLGANPWQQVRHVLLPAALPGYLAGLRQGWAFSWRSLMAAEIIAVGGRLGFGLGSLLQRSRGLGDTPTVLAAVLLILLVGVAVELTLFAPVERRLLRSRGLTPGNGR